MLSRAEKGFILTHKVLSYIVQNMSNVEDTEAGMLADYYPSFESLIGEKLDKWTRFKWNPVDADGNPIYNERGYSELWATSGNNTTVTAGQTPATHPNLYEPVCRVGGLLYWIKPLKAGDGYNIGDRCYWSGKKYESLINDNMTEPGTTAGASSWKQI